MTINESAKLLAYLRACYPSATVEPEMAAVWAMKFVDVPVERVRAAADQHMAEGNRFFPSVPELLAILNAAGADNRSPGEIWSEIRSQLGQSGPPTLSSLAWATAGQLGGWAALRQANEERLLERLPRAVEAAKDELRQRVRQTAIGRADVVMLGDGDGGVPDSSSAAVWRDEGG